MQLTNKWLGGIVVFVAGVAVICLSIAYFNRSSKKQTGEQEKTTVEKPIEPQNITHAEEPQNIMQHSEVPQVVTHSEEPHITTTQFKEPQTTTHSEVPHIITQFKEPQAKTQFKEPQTTTHSEAPIQVEQKKEPHLARSVQETPQIEIHEEPQHEERNEDQSMKKIEYQILVANLLSKHSFEPLDMQHCLIAGLSARDTVISMSLCAFFLKEYTKFYTLITKNNFDSATQPFLSLFKYTLAIPGPKDAEIIEKYKELKCQPCAFSDYDSMMKFVIEKISSEDERVHSMFCNKVVIKTPGELFSPTVESSNTFNFNNAVPNIWLNDVSIEKTCDHLLRSSDAVKDSMNTQNSRGLPSEIESKYSDAIIITTNLYVQAYRDTRRAHRTTLKFRNYGSEEAKYKIKAIICHAKNNEGRSFLSVFYTRTLHVFEEDVREEWIQKMFTNAVFLLYEKE
ncbi:hypothetical protein ENBRE01_1948 [Enteropsectra breve]|nr:hypothetical protein ENBRE01_1948 [Enteropsectra breve]